MTRRTVYRYINLLEEIGFIIDKDWDYRYFIHSDPGEENSEFHFSEEEAVLLNELIAAGVSHHPLKESLMKKLFLNSDIRKMPEQVVKARLGKIVHQLVAASNNGNQVVLKNYHSAHSGEIRDRLVEPFDFTPNYESVIAYEPSSEMTKQYKVERISEVVELDKSFRHAGKHEKPTTDIFGMSDQESIEVELRLSLKAYLLLREEHPGSIPFLTKYRNENDELEYLFKGPVMGFKGIARYILGLIDEITIHQPKALKDHIYTMLCAGVESLNVPGQE